MYYSSLASASPAKGTRNLSSGVIRKRWVCNLLPLPRYQRRPVETLLESGLKYDKGSPRIACDRYSLTAVPEALTISMLPP